MEPEYITYNSNGPLKNQRSVGGTIATLVHLGLGWLDLRKPELKLLDMGPRPNMLYINCGNYFGTMEVGQSIHITSNNINDIYAQNSDGSFYESIWITTLSFRQMRNNEKINYLPVVMDNTFLINSSSRFG